MIKMGVWKMNNFEITKREILGSIIIGAALLIIGFFISTVINEHQMDQNEKYNKAVKIDDSEMFEYGMRTNVGNAFVYGNLEAVDPVTYTEIGGEYMYIKKEKERYTRHCRVVRYKSGETYHTRTEYYWTWDYVDHESKKSKKVNFCGNTFSIKKIDIPSSDKIKTIKKSSRIRYVYYGVPAKCIGTIFTELKNGTIADNNVFYKDMTIEETNNEFQRNAVLPLFWTGWVILSCFIIYGWFYLKNDWLE